MRIHATAVQCFTAHVDALTSKHLAEISPHCAKYVQKTILQALEETIPLNDSEDHKVQVRRRASSVQS